MRLLIGLSIALLFTSSAGASDRFSGRVVSIADGDTLTLLTAEKKQIRIRLAEIDAPEKAQPYGNRAKQELSDLVFGKTVEVVYVDTDRYGRTVGRVYVGNVDVSAELVRSGAAWVYREYNTDRSLLAIESEARGAKRGLWGLSEGAIPPWEWRRGERGGPNAEERDAPANTPTPGFKCGTKHYCREMASCEEALFYLRQCGVTTIDGDHDGVPCEALCR
jgi:endonuclease YncB( thermonuclease family)